MIGLLYKLLAKTVAGRISPSPQKHIHMNQTVFIGGRSILNNILTVKLGMEYAKKTDQDLVMLHNWTMTRHLTQLHGTLLSKLGFGVKISNCIHLLGTHACSRVLVNGRLSQPLHISQAWWIQRLASLWSLPCSFKHKVFM